MAAQGTRGSLGVASYGDPNGGSTGKYNQISRALGPGLAQATCPLLEITICRSAAGRSGGAGKVHIGGSAISSINTPFRVRVRRDSGATKPGDARKPLHKTQRTPRSSSPKSRIEDAPPREASAVRATAPPGLRSRRMGPDSVRRIWIVWRIGFSTPIPRGSKFVRLVQADRFCDFRPRSRPSPPQNRRPRTPQSSLFRRPSSRFPQFSTLPLPPRTAPPTARPPFAFPIVMHSVAERGPTS